MGASAALTNNHQRKCQQQSPPKPATANNHRHRQTPSSPQTTLIATANQAPQPIITAAKNQLPQSIQFPYKRTRLWQRQQTCLKGSTHNVWSLWCKFDAYLNDPLLLKEHIFIHKCKTANQLSPTNDTKELWMKQQPTGWNKQSKLQVGCVGCVCPNDDNNNNNNNKIPKMSDP